MRPKQVILEDSEVIIPVEYNARATSVVATPAGAGDYTISYTASNVLTPDANVEYVPITAMTDATDQQTVELGPITAIKVELNSGDSVTVDITQSRY